MVLVGNSIVEADTITIKNRIQLKITPSLASILMNQKSDWLIIKKEMEKGRTLVDLLSAVAPSYAKFCKAVFNPDTKQFSDEVMVILNGNLVQRPSIMEIKLNDGDIVMLVLMFIGG